MTLLIALVLIGSAAPAITAFAAWYGLTAPWWRSPSGRALFTSALAMALLVDLSLLYHFIGAAVPDVLALTVYALVSASCWLMFGALAHDRWQRRKQRRESHRRVEDIERRLTFLERVLDRLGR